MPLKSELRAEDYRKKARQSSAIADACVLDRTRELHAQSAARWSALALAEEQRALVAPVRLERVAAPALIGASHS